MKFIVSLHLLLEKQSYPNNVCIVCVVLLKSAFLKMFVCLDLYPTSLLLYYYFKNFFISQVMETFVLFTFVNKFISLKALLNMAVNLGTEK